MTCIAALKVCVILLLQLHKKDDTDSVFSTYGEVIQAYKNCGRKITEYEITRKI